MTRRLPISIWQCLIYTVVNLRLLCIAYCTLALVSAFLSATVVFTSERLVNSVTQDASKSVYWLITIASVAITLKLVGGLSDFCQTCLSQACERKTESGLLEHLYDVPLETAETPETQRRVQLAFENYHSTLSSVFTGFVSLACQCVSLALAASVVASWNPVAGALCLVSGVPQGLAVLYSSRYHLRFEMKTADSRRARRYYRLSGLFASNQLEIRVFGSQRFLIGKVLGKMKILHGADRKTLINDHAAHISASALSHVLMGAAVFVVIVSSADGSAAGRAAGILASGAVLQGSVTSIVGAASSLAVLRDRLSVVRDFLSLPRKHIGTQHFRTCNAQDQAKLDSQPMRRAKGAGGNPLGLPPLPPSKPSRRLVVTGLGYRYPNSSRDSLVSANFAAEGGECVAIVGSNGAGKSTLLKLAAGLYTPTRGTAKLYENGTAVQPESTSHVAVVSQDFVRWEMTLRDNILVGRDPRHMSSSHFHALVDTLDMGTVVSSLPKGWDTQIGSYLNADRNLSGGQWQKVALLRGLLTNPPVALLDEPTAMVDGRTEQEFLESYLSHTRSQGIVSLFVAHRIGMVSRADRIVVLQEGQQVACGTHSELSETCKEYRELVNVQSLSAEEHSRRNG